MKQTRMTFAILTCMELGIAAATPSDPETVASFGSSADGHRQVHWALCVGCGNGNGNGNGSAKHARRRKSA